MTTCRDIIQQGLRESGVIAVGTMPEGDEHDEALVRLQSLFKSLFGNELGEPLTSYDFGLTNVSNLTGVLDFDDTSGLLFAPDNGRLIFNINQPATLALNPSPQDGCRFAVIDNLGNFSISSLTIVGNGRRIEGGTSVTLNTDLINREWFYRDDLGSWTRVTDLAADDQSPLPSEFDDLLITLLAIRLNPRYGAETHQETSDVFKRIKTQFRARYRQISEAPSELGLIQIPSRRFTIGSSFVLGN